MTTDVLEEQFRARTPGSRALFEDASRYLFDEVVTNFRLAPGGAAEYFGVEPDLVCLGKILGGGFPIGGFGGRRDIMEKVVTPTAGLWDLKEQIFQSGCFTPSSCRQYIRRNTSTASWTFQRGCSSR
jgi:glutamate-1-semialdehyde aminotransferase